MKDEDKESEDYSHHDLIDHMPNPMDLVDDIMDQIKSKKW